MTQVYVCIFFNQHDKSNSKKSDSFMKVENQTFFLGNTIKTYSRNLSK